jgi:outer membrane protein assembly factor BamB
MFSFGSSLFAQNVQTGIPLWTTGVGGTIVAGPVATASTVYVGTTSSQIVALDVKSGAVLYKLALPGVPGGGGQYSGAPSDIAAGDSLLVVPTGSTITAFG